VDVIDIETMPISDAKKQEVLGIARTDAEIEALLDQGASIYMYYFDYLPDYAAGDSFGDFPDGIKGFQPLAVQDQEAVCEGFVESNVRFWMELDGKRYVVRIDMLDGSVLNFSELSDADEEDTTGIAKETVLNDPEVQALIGDEKLDEDDIRVKDSIVAGGYATVVITVNDDNIILANIVTGSDGNKEVEIVETEVAAITDAKRQEIVDIAVTDPELNDLFSKGASIYKYYFDYIPAYWVSEDGPGLSSPISIENREIICDELTEWDIRCWIEFDGAIYFFQLDMINKTLDWTDSVPAWLYHEIESRSTAIS
jgi:hypothetical protein